MSRMEYIYAEYLAFVSDDELISAIANHNPQILYEIRFQTTTKTITTTEIRRYHEYCIMYAEVYIHINTSVIRKSYQ